MKASSVLDLSTRRDGLNERPCHNQEAHKILDTVLLYKLLEPANPKNLPQWGMAPAGVEPAHEKVAKTPFPLGHCALRNSKEEINIHWTIEKTEIPCPGTPFMQSEITSTTTSVAVFLIACQYCGPPWSQIMSLLILMAHSCSSKERYTVYRSSLGMLSIPAAVTHPLQCVECFSIML